MKKKNSSLRWRMVQYFMTIVVIAGLCLLVFYQVAADNLTSVSVEAMENVLAKINLDTYNTLHEAQEMAYLVSKDKDIQLALRGDLPEETRELYSQRVERNFQMMDMSRFTKNLDGIYVIGENGARFRSVNQSMYDMDFRQEEWYQTVKETQQPLWVCQEKGSFIVRDMDEYMVSIMIPIIDRASYRFLGVTLVDVLMENLAQMSQNGMVFDGIILLLDEENQVLYSDRTAGEKEKRELEQVLAGLELQEQKTISIRVGKTGFLFSHVPLDIAGWKIAGMVSNQTIYAKIDMIRGLMLFLCVICIGVSMLLAALTSKGILEPILKIRSVMKEVEKGNLQTHVKISQQDEIGELAHSFNHMIDKLELYVRREEENQKKLRIAEFNALQAQINPHFLYNTLDSINWMARAGQIDQVSEMINSLSVFFRIGLSRGKTFITIEEELRHVENYILIQKKRYEKYLDYEIAAPENVKNFQCLKMILQPLVENSIYHGIKEKGEKGLIRISVEELQNTLVFRVTDTGQGMTPKKLSELHEMMQKELEYDANAYGVINVQRRIQTYFGKEYGLHFQSVWGKGTQVTVVIPKRVAQEGTQDVESCDC